MRLNIGLVWDFSPDCGVDGNKFKPYWCLHHLFCNLLLKRKYRWASYQHSRSVGALAPTYGFSLYTAVCCRKEAAGLLFTPPVYGLAAARLFATPFTETHTTGIQLNDCWALQAPRFMRQFITFIIVKQLVVMQQERKCVCGCTLVVLSECVLHSLLGRVRKTTHSLSKLSLFKKTTF